jgi:carbon monoxide dehydrogenase subunit G
MDVEPAVACKPDVARPDVKFVQSVRGAGTQTVAMTKAFTAETTIDRPIGEVWARLIDWDHAAHWLPGVDALRADGPTAVGTSLIFTARGRERTSCIAALEPGRSVTLRSVQGGVTADYVYTCARHDGGTRVSLAADCRMTGPVRLFGPLIRAAIRRADGRQLEAFAAAFGPG